MTGQVITGRMAVDVSAETLGGSSVENVEGIAGQIEVSIFGYIPDSSRIAECPDWLFKKALIILEEFPSEALKKSLENPNNKIERNFRMKICRKKRSETNTAITRKISQSVYPRTLPGVPL